MHFAKGIHLSEIVNSSKMLLSVCKLLIVCVKVTVYV